MGRASDKDIDALVESEYQEGLADGEQWAEEAYEARQEIARTVLVTAPQGRVLGALDRYGPVLESSLAQLLYGRGRGRGNVTRMCRTLAGLGLIEKRTAKVHNLFNPTWQRTDKPYEVRS